MATKRKTNWKEIHKIRVHDNRWLAWTIAISILVCASLIGYIQVSEIYFQNQIAELTLNTNNWRTFNHPSGYSFKYPRHWGLESEGASNISVVSPTNVEEYFAVTAYKASEEKVIKESLFKTKETIVQVHGITAIKISQDKKQPENVVLVREGDRLFVLRGKGAAFDRIIETFTLTQKFERI